MKRKWCPEDKQWVTPEKEFNPLGLLFMPGYLLYYLFFKPGECPHCGWRNLADEKPADAEESKSETRDSDESPATD